MADLIALRDELLRLLRAQTNWTVFDGEPPALVPLDSAGRALAYACLYMSPSYRDEYGENLCADPGFEQFSGQVTVASGYIAPTLRAVEKVQAALLGKWLTASSGRIRLDPAGMLLVDRDVQPPRWFVPMGFRVDLG